MYRVLITGATGFLGSNLIENLTEFEAQFFLLTRNSDNKVDTNNLNYITCDITDFEQVTSVLESIKPTHLINMAWGMIPSDYNHPENFDYLNASINLLHEFQKNGGNRVLSIGTCFEYSWEQALCIEDVTGSNHSNLYASTKNILKDYTTTFCRHYNIASAWIRPFFLYGPYENPKRLVPNIILNLLQGKEVIINNGEIYRDYMYVMDAVMILKELIFSEFTGTLNISSGIPIKLGDLGRKAAAILGREDLLQVKSPAKITNRIVMGDTTKLEKHFDLELTEFDSALESTIDWWKNKSE